MEHRWIIPLFSRVWIFSLMEGSSLMSSSLSMSDFPQKGHFTDNEMYFFMICFILIYGAIYENLLIERCLHPGFFCWLKLLKTASLKTVAYRINATLFDKCVNRKMHFGLRTFSSWFISLWKYELLFLSLDFILARLRIFPILKSI